MAAPAASSACPLIATGEEVTKQAKMLGLVLLIAAIRLEASPVTLPSIDSFPVQAEMYVTERPNRPLVLMYHQCNRDQSAFRPVAEYLLSRGYNVATFDFRGFGRASNVGSFSEDRSLWHEDARAVISYLSLKDLTQSGFFVLGASCGGSLALSTGRYPGAPRVDGVIYLSGRTVSAFLLADSVPEDYRDEGSPPFLGLSAKGDTGAHADARSLFETSSHRLSRNYSFPGNAHGAPLLDEYPDGMKLIADWLDIVTE